MSIQTPQQPFWSANQPGFRFSNSPAGSREFFREVEEHRYTLEPHIPEIVDFERWSGADVLEVGCGIATDGTRFARAGARYHGVDMAPAALKLARRRFDLERLKGSFEQAPATDLPFPGSSFDLVYSHGVLHHFERTAEAIDEIHRVLRPGGTVLVMLYHRSSVNYHLLIMGLRRVLAATLLVPGMGPVLSRVLGEEPEVLHGHRELLREHGLRYLTDRQLFLSNNTDGPGNPLSKVYTREEARALFSQFEDVRTAVRHLNLRIVPGGRRIAASQVGRRLGERWGWHLYVSGRKG